MWTRFLLLHNPTARAFHQNSESFYNSPDYNYKVFAARSPIIKHFNAETNVISVQQKQFA